MGHACGCLTPSTERRNLQCVTKGGFHMSLDAIAANRRQFLKWMSASPLLASPGIASIAALAAEAVPTTRSPDPLMWGSLSPQNIITNPKDAINVFDFELACRKNVPPAHFGYMASGI